MSRMVCLVLLAGVLVSRVAAAPLDVDQWRTQLAAVDQAGQLTALNAQLLTSLQERGNADSLVVAAQLFGLSVDRARALGRVPPAVLTSLLVDSEALYERCRQTLHYLEAQAGEDEAALERLYRSDVWFDLNHSLATFRYWQAWVELLSAQTAADPDAAIGHLARAEHGFQVVAMRILYPGLVYGSWLGLAYVELVRDNGAAAQTRLELLRQAIVDDEGNPLLDIVERELALLAIGRGELTPLSDTPLTAASSRQLAEEAFYLLEEHRRTETGAIEAARRLQTLLTSEYLNDALLSRVVSYREEVVGHAIGVVGRLVEAEYAYDYQKYNTVVLKFREFIRQGGMALPLDLTRYRYHYAVALREIGLYSDAQQVLAQLVQSPDTPPSSLPALAELRFMTARDIYDDHPGLRNAQELRAAAQSFVTLAPDKEAAGFAWLALALLSEDSSETSSHLQQASRYSNLEGAVGLTRFKNLSTQLQQAYRRDDAVQQQALAERGLQVYRQLDAASRELPEVTAMALQMAVIAAVDSRNTLDEIAQLEQQAGLAQPVQRLLYWSRLRALDALDDQPTALTAFIAGSANGTMPVWQREEVFRLLLEKERAGAFSQLTAMADAFLPALDSTPDDQRQLGLIQLRALRALGHSEQAWLQAKALVGKYPDSGDAWIAYTALAETLGLQFEADRGWSTIARALPPGSPRWLQAMVSRLALAPVAESSACTLQQKILPYQSALQGALLATYNNAVAALDCSATTSGDS